MVTTVKARGLEAESARTMPSVILICVISVVFALRMDQYKAQLQVAELAGT